MITHSNVLACMSPRDSKKISILLMGSALYLPIARESKKSTNNSPQKRTAGPQDGPEVHRRKRFSPLLMLKVKLTISPSKLTLGISSLKCLLCFKSQVISTVCLPAMAWKLTLPCSRLINLGS